MTYDTRALLVLFLCTLSLAGCDGDTPTSVEDVPDDLLVTWFATKLDVDGRSLYDEGTRVEWAFDGAGQWWLDVSRDGSQIFCDEEDGPGADCSSTGQFAASETALVILDGGEPDVTFTMTITDEPRLRLRGDIDGMAVDWEFVAPPLPDLIGTWEAVDVLSGGERVEEGGLPTSLAVTFEPDGTYAYTALFSPLIGSPHDYFCGELFCHEPGLYRADAETSEVVLDGTAFQVASTPLDLFLSNGEVEWWFTKVSVESPWEEGRWLAIQLDRNGTDLVETGNGTFFRITLDGSFLEAWNGLAPGQPRFLCDPEPGNPEACGTSGGYEVSLDALVLTREATGEVVEFSLSNRTPLTLELGATIDGANFSFLLARERDYPGLLPLKGF